ncbi:type II secretion system F family protein [bacterium]|nr:type II secretion system F family protein [bacterium]
MKIKYQGYDNAAKKVSGEIEVASAAEARNQLRSQGIRATKLVAIEGGKGRAKAKASAGRDDTKPAIDWSDLNTVLEQFASSAPPLVEFAAFIRQMAVMQSAGISMVQALGVLSETAETKGFGRALANIKRRVEEGQSFTESLKKYPVIFDRIFINLIAAGEISGSLDRILERLAGYYEKTSKLRRQIVSALAYPAFMLVLMVLIVAVMLIFVVPTFAEMFSGQGAALPESTQMIMSISDFLIDFWWAVLGCGGALLAGLVAAFKNQQIRSYIDPLLLKIPFLGELFAKVSIARFARTFGTLIQSGVPILEALDITARVAGNIAVESTLLSIKDEVSQGNSISGPLMKSKIFPKMATSMIAIGEQTGAIDSMLEKIADFYEDEVDAVISGLTSVIEPLMIVMVGAVVAGILIPMYMPIFKMSEVMSGG